MSSASPPTFRAAVPGTSTALPQVPFTWFTTNACCPELSLYQPPALQFPAEAQDIDSTPAFPLFKAAVPGTSTALPQVPFTWFTTNACCPKPFLYQPPALQLPAEAHDTDS